MHRPPSSSKQWALSSREEDTGEIGWVQPCARSVTKCHHAGPVPGPSFQDACRWFFCLVFLVLGCSPGLPAKHTLCSTAMTQPDSDGRGLPGCGGRGLSTIKMPTPLSPCNSLVYLAGQLSLASLPVQDSGPHTCLTGKH